MNSMIQKDERHTLLHNRAGHEQEFGQQVFEIISRLKAANRVVSVRIDGNPGFGVVEWTPEHVTWIAYADHPSEQGQEHVVELRWVETIDIEDAGPAL